MALRIDSVPCEWGHHVGTLSCWFPEPRDRAGGMAFLRVGNTGCLVVRLRGLRVTSDRVCIEDESGRWWELRLISRV